MQVRPRDDADLVVAARAGESDAFGELFERWFDPVYDVARNIVRNTESAADVAQDTFVAAWEGLDRLERPEAFGGWILRIARNRALNRLERESRSRPLEASTMTGLHDNGAADPVGSSNQELTEDLYEAHERAELLGVAAAALGPRDASLLDLHLRHGLTPAEIAEELDITPNNAHQLLFRLRTKLGNAISASMLWRDGSPQCQELARELAGLDAFDGDAVALIDRHSKRCPDCAEERKAGVMPWRMFAAVPIAVAPLALRAKTAAALHAAGVPVGGAAAAAAAAAGGTATGAGAGGAAAAGAGAASAGAAGGTALGTTAWIGIATAAAVAAVGVPVGIATINNSGPGDQGAGEIAVVDATSTTLGPPSSTTVVVGTTVPASTGPATTLPVTTTTLPVTTTTRPGSPTTTSTALDPTTTTPGAGPSGGIAPPAITSPPPTTGATSPTTTPTTTAGTNTTTATTAPTTVPPATTAPPAPTTVPTTVPATTNPPATTTTTAPSELAIVRFQVEDTRPPGASCPGQGPGRVPRRFGWTTTGAVGGSLSVAGSTTEIAAEDVAEGTTIRCVTIGNLATLEVVDADGNVVSEEIVVGGTPGG